MYKVIVVDDEPLLLMGIKSCINWGENGYEFAGQAQNGRDALLLIETVRPDIIFTDIKMPYMDGIELLRVVTRDYPDCKVVVLSCLSEMEVVREALMLGASDYILKLSMQPEDLLGILEKTAEKLEISRKQKSQLKDAERVLGIHKKQIEQEVFYSFLNGTYDFNTFLKQAENKNIELPSGMLALACIKAYRIEEGKEANEIEIVSEAEQLLESILSQIFIGFITFIKDSHIILLCSAEQLGTNTDEIVEFLKNIQKQMEKSGLGLLIGITSGFVMPDCLCRYKQAVRACDYCFYETDSSIVSTYYIPYMDMSPFVISLSDEQQIFKDIVSKQMSEAEQRIKILFQDAKKNSTEPSLVKKGAENFCYGIVCRTERMYGSAFHELEEINYRAEIAGARTLCELENYAVSFLGIINDSVRRNGSSSCRKEIILAKQYVYDHIGEDIVLEQVARHVNISRSYFSMLFKQIEKESFTQFVNRTKMETAKQLLMAHQYHIYEVAEKVGIENENYFTKLFKRYIGVNPSSLIVEKRKDQTHE